MSDPDWNGDWRGTLVWGRADLERECPILPGDHVLYGSGLLYWTSADRTSRDVQFSRHKHDFVASRRKNRVDGV